MIPPVSDHFTQVCRERLRHPAVVQDDLTLTYQDLSRWADAVALALERSGSVCGRGVAMLLPNSGAFVAAFMGVARAGGVVAPLSPRYRPDELGQYLADIEPLAIVVGPETIGPVREALATQERRQPALVSVDVPGGADLLELGDSSGGPTFTGGDPPLLLLYTSGSTEAPKRVLRSHRQVALEVEALRGLFGVTPSDRLLCAAPFWHVNGLVRSFLTGTLAGATLYPVERFGRRHVPEVISRERLTVFGGVPSMFVALSGLAPHEPADLSSLRVLFSASAPLLPSDASRFHARYGLWIRQLYGSTETGTITYNDHPRIEAYLETVGRAIPGVSLTVVDEHGGPVPVGREGEIVVSSPFAASGHNGNAEPTKARFPAGTYVTGDLGRIDGEEYVTLAGRKGWLINRRGYKVNPHEVEKVVRRHPGVAEAMVAGEPGPHGDEIIRCIVVARAPLTAGEIARYCRERLADFKVPTRIEFRDRLPRTATGKIRRADL